VETGDMFYLTHVKHNAIICEKDLKMQEEWKKINEYDDYMISNNGKVKSLKFENENILKPYNNKGYMYIKISMNGKVKQFKIHRLVAKAFIKNEYSKPDINHLDNNPSNNRVENLEWCTHKENMEYARKQGRTLMTKMHRLGPIKQKIRTKLKYNKLNGMNFGSIKILKYLKQNGSAPRADVLCERCGIKKYNKDIRGELRGTTRMCGSCKNKSKGRFLKFKNKHKDIV